MTKFYNYAPTTGEYLGEGVAFKDPMGGPDLVPANATLEEPPAIGAGMVSIWNELTGWEVILDRRGEPYWLADGTPKVVTDLSEAIPADATFEPPPPSADALLAQIETQEAIRIDRGFVLSDGTSFRCDNATLTKLNGFALVSAEQWPVVFTTRAGKVFEFASAAAITALAQQAANHVAAVLKAATGLRQAVVAGTFVGEISDDANWP